MPNVSSAASKERKRVEKRNTYEFIKLNDPEKYAQLLLKERNRYQKRRETKKLKNITQMTEREKRAKRRQWKINKRNSRRNKAENSTVEEVKTELADEVNPIICIQEEDPLAKLNDNRDLQINNRLLRLRRLTVHLKNKLSFYERKIQRLRNINNRYRVILHRSRKGKNVKSSNKQF